VRGKGTSLRAYLVTRLALAIPTVLILLTLVFLLMRVAPGDPIQAALGGHVSQEEIAKRREAAGYDRPLLTQYLEYLGDAFTLDLGTTLTDRREVTSIIQENGAATLELSIWAFIIAVVVGVSIGLVAGRYRDTPIDTGGRLFGIIVYAAPVFFRGSSPSSFSAPSWAGYPAPGGPARSSSSSSTRSRTSISSTRQSAGAGTPSGTSCPISSCRR
jgi:peptide/nickel transport system permease protein